jgi:hypothetical protein
MCDYSLQHVTSRHAKHEGKNYYLALATHDEVRSDPAGFYDRIKRGCSDEFPFLF